MYIWGKSTHKKWYYLWFQVSFGVLECISWGQGEITVHKSIENGIMNPYLPPGWMTEISYLLYPSLILN